MPPSSPGSPALTFEQLLHTPPVIAALDRVLPKYGFRGQDLDDGRQEVFTMALAAKGDRPTTQDGTVAFCIVLAHRLGVSTLIKNRKRAEAGFAGTTDREDAAIAMTHERWDVLDRKKLLEVLHRSVPGHVVEAFEDIAEGTAQTEIAARRGVSHKKVRSEVEKGRFKLRHAIIAAGMGTLLAAGAAVLLYIRSNATPTEEAHPTPSAPPTQMLVEEDPLAKKKAQAAELRRQAAELCKARRWVECGQALDGALALDPDGEDDPAVGAMRDAVDRAMSAKLAPVQPTPKPSAKPAPTPR
ncbi:MAG: hypothetical protein ABSE49_32345 [Polyangiaceae bacterium]|jgi:DNA-directed RNA polymerase specialized sigma24 family protein